MLIYFGQSLFEYIRKSKKMVSALQSSMTKHAPKGLIDCELESKNPVPQSSIRYVACELVTSPCGGFETDG